MNDDTGQDTETQKTPTRIRLWCMCGHSASATTHTSAAESMLERREHVHTRSH